MEKLGVGSFMQQGDIICEAVNKVVGKKLNHLTLAEKVNKSR